MKALKIQFFSSKNRHTRVRIIKDQIKPGQLNPDQIVDFQSDRIVSSTSINQSDVISQSKSVLWIRLRNENPVVPPSHNIVYSMSKSINLMSNPWRQNLYGSILETSSGLNNDEDKQAFMSQMFSIELVVYFASKYYLNHVWAPQNKQNSPPIGMILLDHENHVPALSMFLFTLQIFVQFMNIKSIDQTPFDDFDVRDNVLSAAVYHWNGEIDHFGLFFDARLVDIIMFYFKLATKVVHGSEATPDFLAMMKRLISESQAMMLKHLKSSIKNRNIPTIFPQ